MNRRSEKVSTLSSRAPAFLLAAVLIGGGAFAVFHTDSSASAEGTPASSTEARGGGAEDPMMPPALSSNQMGALPPGHPSIAAASNDMSGAATNAAASDSPQFWVAPPTWKSLPNPSTMRLATYRIPRADGDTQDTDLSVVQAGGTADANIERWLGQFDQAGKDTRTVKVVHGMKVTIVEVQGTYLGGGMMADNKPSTNPGFALLAAIVETPGTPTFFKMVGPAKSVVAAKPAFGALLASVTPPAPQ